MTLLERPPVRPSRRPVRPRGRATPPRRIDVRAMDEEDLFDLAERLRGEPVPGLRMTEAEFVAWCPEHLRAEWVNGEVILMPPVSDGHSDLNSWLLAIIRMFIEHHALGVLRFDFFVRLPRRRRRRVPDLLFVANEHRHRLRPTFLDGPPDLAVEIVSDDSVARDWQTKHREYEAAGVREYWIIDPLHRSVEAYQLSGKGKTYQRVKLRDGKLASAVLPGFYLRPEWLWRSPLPKVAEVLKELGVK